VGFVCLLCGCFFFHWFGVRLGSFRLWVVVFFFFFFFFFFRKISIEKVSVHLKKKRDTEPSVKFLAATLSLVITGSVQ
jgi:hypothetical protein